MCFKDDASYAAFDGDFREMKAGLFGDESYNLHTAEITRPGKAADPATRKFFDAGFRAEFYGEMNALIARTPVKVIAAAVMKDRVAGLPDGSRNDPYLFTFDFVLNQALVLCGPRRTCSIYPERRTHTENNKVEIALVSAKNAGTASLKGSEVAERIGTFAFRDKRDDLSGLQLADLVVTPIGRHLLGKPTKPDGNEVRYSVVREKIAERDFLVFP